jgi:hypothetical protein
VACTRGPKGVDLPDKLTWSFRWLDKAAHWEVYDTFPKDQIEKWQTNGMDDFEADAACIAVGMMPHSVFPGYLEAGIDYEVYP